MKKVITIVILDYNLITDSENFHNKYRLYDAETKSLLTDIMEIHTLKMRKLPKDLENPDMDEKTKRRIGWLKFIGTEKEEEGKMLATKNSAIHEAYVKLKEFSRDEKTAGCKKNKALSANLQRG